MRAHFFKAPNSFNEFVEFFSDIFNEAEQLQEDFSAGKNYHYFEVDEHGTTFLLAGYSPEESIKDFEKEIFHVSDYGLLVRDDIEEYIFLKYNEGTGKIERLKKKRDGMEMAFIKKLEKLSFGNLGALDKIFDRSEFVKEFYDLYCDTEEFLKRKIQGIPEQEDLNLYVKILLNRLMFLWFLQKKGLLDGNDENYLLTKFREVGADKNKGGNDFFDFLNTLFFQGLCVKESERRKDVAGLIGDIPFLNGGLFIESEVEQKYQNISIPNDAFHRPIVYPITKGEKNVPALNLFESKEWTIDERSGDVNHISPEILGYIFEKSINQKGLGAFYTPEEITTYIAKNTIHPYLLGRIKEVTGNSFDSVDELLKNADDAVLKTLYNELKDIKIQDPAVGSGHFLVDAMLVLQRIYESLRDKGSHDWKSYQIREYIIKNNLYGVDIVTGAVEICKLRMFLALAETFTSRLEIQPLPNIDFNFRVGNSLIGYTDIDKVNQENLALSGEVINKMGAILGFIKKHYPGQLLLMRTLNEKLQKLEVLKPKEMFDVRTKLVKLYTSEHDRELATKLRSLLDDLTDAFNKELNRLLFGELRKKVKGLTVEELGRDKLKAFHWAMEFSEVFEKGGFDIVIGNPPYIRIQFLKRTSSGMVNYFNYTFTSAIGNYDIYLLFVENGLNLLQKRGLLSFIMPHKFFNATYGSGLRKILRENKCVREVIDFTHCQVFIGATTYTCILTLGKNSSNYLRYVKVENLSSPARDMQFILKNRLIKLPGITSNLLPLNVLNSEPWVLGNIEELKILHILGDVNNSLEDASKRIFQGLRTSADSVYVFSGFERLDNCYRVFSTETKKEHLLEKDLLKFLAKGRNVKRFHVRKTNKLILFPYEESGGKVELIHPEIFKEKYPKTWTYLNECKERLESRENGKMRNEKWYAYIYPKALDIMHLSKIITPDIAYQPTFALDPVGVYYFTSGYGIIPQEQYSKKYILGLLNSKMLGFFLRKQSTDFRGGYRSFEFRFIKKLPIYSAKPEKQLFLVILTDYLLFLNQYYYNRHESQGETNPGLKEKINYFEDLANWLVYELYFKEELRTELLTLVKGKLKPVDYDEWIKLEFEEDSLSDDEEKCKEQHEKENFKTIEEVYDALQEDKNIRNTIAYIKSHPIIVHIEGGETEKLKEILASETDDEAEKEVSGILSDVATGNIDIDEGYSKLKDFVSKK